MAVGPPVDLVAYVPGELDLRRRTRLTADDPRLTDLRRRWESELRRVIQSLPGIEYGEVG